MSDLNFFGRQPRIARKLCKPLKKEVRRKSISECFNWKSSAVIAAYASSEIRFSFAKAVYVYPHDNGWTADVDSAARNAPSSEHLTLCLLKHGLKPSG